MPSSGKPKCLIAAGGTAGHVLPALAVAESLSQLGAEVSFASNTDSKLVRDAGYELDVFAVEGFPREPSMRLARAIGRAAAAVPACVRILRKRRPDVVLGGGGYVAGPMVLAAGIMRIPAALSEADARFGLANRLAAPFAKSVFLALPVDALEPPKYQVVGRPIPARSRKVDSAEARRRFDLPREGPIVLVFGGSQGAQRLNEAAIEAFGSSGPAVLHLAGERDYPALAEQGVRPDYRLLPFTEDFGAALSASDLVVARSGGSVWEVAAAGRPALLVPYLHATADHQAENGRYFERGGGAVVVPEQELDLRRQVDELLADPERLKKMGDAMKSLARPQAADDIAKELLRLAS